METIFTHVATNLEIKEKNQLDFPFLDYGYLYGYGLFESIKVVNGKAILIDAHIQRIKRGAIILDIPFLWTPEDVKSKANELIEKNNITRGILNFYLTPGNRSHDPAITQINDPFFLMLNREWPNYPDDFSATLELRQESFQKTQLDRLKTLSWMKNVLENRLNKDTDDVLLYNERHEILETTRANVYFVKGNTIHTPKSPVILPGIIRQFLINNQQEMGFEVIERTITSDELADFDEIFLSNALRGVFSVKKILRFDGLSSGPVASQIKKRFNEILEI